MPIASGKTTTFTGAWLASRAKRLAQKLLQGKLRHCSTSEVQDGYLIRANRCGELANGLVLDPPGNLLLVDLTWPVGSGARGVYLFPSHPRDPLNPDANFAVSTLTPLDDPAGFGNAGRIWAQFLGDVAVGDEAINATLWRQRGVQSAYGVARSVVRIKQEDPLQFDYYGLVDTPAEVRTDWFDYGCGVVGDELGGGTSGRIGYRLSEDYLASITGGQQLFARVPAYYGYEAPYPFAAVGVSTDAAFGLVLHQLLRQTTRNFPLDYGLPCLWLQRFTPSFLTAAVQEDGATALFGQTRLVIPEDIDPALAERPWQGPPTGGWPLQGVEYVDEFWENFDSFPAGILPQWFDDLCVADDGTQFVVRGVLSSVLDATVSSTSSYYLRVARTSVRGTLAYDGGPVSWSVEAQELFADQSGVDFGVPISEPGVIHMEHVLGMQRVGDTLVEVLVRYEAERGVGGPDDPGGTSTIALADLASRRFVFVVNGVETEVLGTDLGAYPQGTIALMSLPAGYYVDAVGARYSGQCELADLDGRRLLFFAQDFDLGQRYLCWYDTVTQVATRGAVVPAGTFDDPTLERTVTLQVIQRAALDDAGAQIKPATLMLSYNGSTFVWLSKDSGQTWTTWVTDVDIARGAHYIGNAFHVGKRLGQLCRD